MAFNPFAYLGALILALPGLLNVKSPLIRMMEQGVSSELPNELIPLTDLIQANHRLLISENDLYFEASKQGFSKSNVDIIREVVRPLLDGYELIGLWRRGVLDADSLLIEGSKHGFTSEYLEHLKKVSEAIPSPSDIIRFAVREVYSPTIANSFGQYEGFESVASIASKDLSAVGMSPETFKKFWAAHWDLPSIQMGFEMLHRRIIPATGNAPGIPSLESLLIALDIMPAWREPLKQLSYHPLTRVDVRRMYGMKVISLEEVYKTYLDLGYSDLNARRLTEFTRLSVLPKEERDKELGIVRPQKDKDLSKSDIIGGYKDALLSRSTAFSMLIALGYDNTESNFYLNDADSDAKKVKIQAEKTTLKTLYIKGKIDRSTVHERLTAAGLDSKGVSELIELWNIEKESNYKVIPLSDLKALFESGIITSNVFTEEMKIAGYNDTQIDYYLKWIKQRETGRP